MPSRGSEEVVDTLPAGTHTVIVATADAFGLVRGKRFHADMWDHVAKNGVAVANVIFALDMTCDVWETAYCSMATGYPDLVITPLPGSMRPVPWHPGTVLVMCESREEDGSPVRIDPRHALQRIVDKAEDLGFTPKIGVELEFYLLDPETRRPRDRGIQVYGIARGSQFEDVLQPIRNACTEMGVPIEASNPEYAPGQFEVNIRYDDAIRSAENAVLFRNAVKEIAWSHGLLATFMAKPFADAAGSGMHIHQSLWKDGKNAFADGHHMSQLGMHYLGGLRAHIGEMTLFGSPTPNSYKRRTPYTFCPVNNSWGGDNRTVALRVIEGREEAVRIEQRDASAEANPFLAITAQLAAGVDGIEHQTDPGPKAEGDAYADESHDPLPKSIAEAVAALRNSHLAAETFHADHLRVILEIAEREQTFLDSAVTDFEKDRYMEVL
jgi:glutamine synthetase